MLPILSAMLKSIRIQNFTLIYHLVKQHLVAQHQGAAAPLSRT